MKTTTTKSAADRQIDILREQIEIIREGQRRRRRALRLHEAGKTLQEIGKQFNCTRQRVWAMIEKARAEAQAQ